MSGDMGQVAGEDAQPSGVGPLTWCACWWIAGVWLGHAWPELVFWLGAASLISLGLIVLVWRGKGNAARAWGVVGLFAVAGAWTIVREHRLPPDSIEHYLADESQLVQVTGVVDAPPTLAAADEGAFAAFSYRAPVTLFALNVETIQIGDEAVPVQGMLLTKIEQADPRIHGGERISAIGWMAGIDGPANPGERDYKTQMRRRGIVGRMTLRNPGNCRILDRAPPRGRWHSLRAFLNHAASTVLQRGLDRELEDRQRLAFLDAILLGRNSGDLRETYESFRVTGLAHILSLSGAHLGILLWFVWILARIVTPYPSRAAMMVLVVLGLYVMSVELRTPIVRAGIMAAVFALVHATGRRARAIDVLSVAAIIALIWRPGDLFDVGFQLSFLAVAGLVLFTRRVSHWLIPPPLIPRDDVLSRWRYRVRRKFADAVAVSIVAFSVVAPLVAYHFKMITPWSVLLSVLTLPLVTALLGVGYLKIFIGMVLPSFGVLLATPLQWLADAMLGSIAWAASWDIIAVEFRRPPSPMWTTGTTLLAAAVFSGHFARRKLALAAALVLCALWLHVEVNPDTARRLNPFASEPSTITLNMFSVSDGSCYLVRTHSRDAQGRTREHVLMFDCGSQAYFDTGIKSILPALRSLGVRRIDTLVLSHADLDHFSGALDVADGMAIGRVLVTPHMFREANDRPQSATAFLIDGLQQRHIPIESVVRGWREVHGDVAFEMIWPPADFDPEALANDQSTVLSVRGGGRRVLLCGDIQQQAMEVLLAGDDDLTADVCDIPHHGSFVAAAPAFLTRVSPYIVLQSSGPGRLYHDKWAPFFVDKPLDRLITATHGMVEVRINADGELTWSVLRK